MSEATTRKTRTVKPAVFVIEQRGHTSPADSPWNPLDVDVIVTDAANGKATIKALAKDPAHKGVEFRLARVIWQGVPTIEARDPVVRL